MIWFQILVILAALYVLALAGYRVVLAGLELKKKAAAVQQKLSDFGPDHVELEAAKPVFADDLPRLLRERREMQKRKAREREERQRRLVARISSINIDRR